MPLVHAIVEETLTIQCMRNGESLGSKRIEEVFRHSSARSTSWQAQREATPALLLVLALAR